jgi:hypothetical protein
MRAARRNGAEILYESLLGLEPDGEALRSDLARVTLASDAEMQMAAKLLAPSPDVKKGLGIGVAKDVPRAVSLYQRSCRATPSESAEDIQKVWSRASTIWCWQTRLTIPIIGSTSCSYRSPSRR